MIKSFFAATVLLAATVVPALAKDVASRTFTRDGETYVYTTVNKGDHVLIRGRQQSTGSAFELDVRGSRVVGMSGGVPVAFTVANAQAKLTATELALR